MADTILTVAVALIGAIGGGIVSGWFNRRKTSAEAEATIAATATKAAKELIAEYKAQADIIQGENKHLIMQVSELRQADRENKTELHILAKSIENLNAQVLKYRLIIAIFSMHFRLLGYEPMIHPDNIDGMTIDELNDIAASMNSVQRRRDEAVSRND